MIEQVNAQACIEEVNAPVCVAACVEALLERAVAMERGGNLETLLEKESAEIKKVLYEEVLKRRQEAAHAKAAFPPSGMSALQGADDAPSRSQGALGADPGRGGSL